MEKQKKLQQTNKGKATDQQQLIAAIQAA